MIEAEKRSARLKPLLRALGVASSTWYHQSAPEPKRPGPAPKPLAWYRLSLAPDDGQLVIDLADEVERDFRLTV